MQGSGNGERRRNGEGFTCPKRAGAQAEKVWRKMKIITIMRNSLPSRDTKGLEKYIHYK